MADPKGSELYKRVYGMQDATVAETPSSRTEAYDAERSTEEKKAYEEMRQRLMDAEQATKPAETTPTPTTGVSTGPAPSTRPAGQPGLGVKDYMSEIASRAEELPPEQKEDFSQDMAELRSWYTQAQDRLETGEIVERMAHALTQMGAGMWGLKHGTDMSGLKFDKADWDKKMDRTLSEFKVRLDEIEGRRKEAGEERRFGAQQRLAKRGQDIGMAESRGRQALDRKQLEELIRHNKSTEAALLEKGSKKTDITKMFKDIDATVKDAVGDSLRERASDDEKLRAMSTRLSNNLNLPYDEVEQRLRGDSWFFDQSPDEALQTVTEIAKEMKLKRLESAGAADSAPKPGDVVDGYTFKGGDPADPASWKAP